MVASKANQLDKLPRELKGMIGRVIGNEIDRYAWRVACGLETICHKCLTDELPTPTFFVGVDGKYHNLLCTHNLGQWSPFQDTMLSSQIRERSMAKRIRKAEEDLRSFKRTRF